MQEACRSTKSVVYRVYGLAQRDETGQVIFRRYDDFKSPEDACKYYSGRALCKVPNSKTRYAFLVHNRLIIACEVCKPLKATWRESKRR